ncbi:MAG: CDP-glucose 4,6-dehydratase [Akkermansiaceae bacterium]|jgi:CDP-glucose 4,6-dehydratase|nr:CDP-glucose 4,6-dehydratase [Luteolibacter sp.]
MFSNFYKNRRVLVTGHTGFKGSWLCEWLLSLGAEVAGYALDPQPHEVLYDQLQLDSRISQDHRADISNLTKIHQVISTFKPEVIFHLAAQPLVRLSYEQPVETFATNVMGTVNLLEAVRLSDNPCTVLCVTTDKCYENKEWLHAYREEDPMGGHDPYSASKGAAELVIASYRRSFFSSPVPCSLSPVPSSSPSIRIASARAGNVIGGGDWAVDRIVPDCIRSIRAGQPIPVRNKIATRPWQHVLEPLSGYLHLAASLASSSSSLSENPSSVLRPPTSSLTSAFNFGPALDSNRTVEQLVIELVNHTGGKWSDASDPNAVHEASKLNLAIDKAFHLLNWKPTWDFETTIQETAAWYLAEARGEDPKALTQSQINAYHQAASAKGLAWA